MVFDNHYFNYVQKYKKKESKQFSCLALTLNSIF